MSIKSSVHSCQILHENRNILALAVGRIKRLPSRSLSNPIREQYNAEWNAVPVPFVNPTIHFKQSFCYVIMTTGVAATLHAFCTMHVPVQYYRFAVSYDVKNRTALKNIYRRCFSLGRCCDDTGLRYVIVKATVTGTNYCTALFA